MTHRELMELALLDVLALLDEDEREAFDRAFAAAPPHIQSQVRREQTRLSRMNALLPDVEPPVYLRAKVIEAVRAAFRSRTSPAEAAARRLAHAPIRRPTFTGHRRKVTALWRAAALGFAAAAIGFASTTLLMKNQYDKLQQMERNDSLLSEMVATFGPRYVMDALFDAKTQRVVLSSTTVEGQGRASVWFNPDWTAARLFATDLPRGEHDETYRLVILDNGGNVVQEVTQFTFQGGLLNREIPTQMASANDRLGIIAGPVQQPRLLLTTAAIIPPA